MCIRDRPSNQQLQASVASVVAKSLALVQQQPITVASVVAPWPALFAGPPPPKPPPSHPPPGIGKPPPPGLPPFPGIVGPPRPPPQLGRTTAAPRRPP
eukprot:11179247-Lingulodinium_polyedra.AAC.1